MRSVHGVLKKMVETVQATSPWEVVDTYQRRTSRSVKCGALKYREIVWPGQTIRVMSSRVMCSLSVNRKSQGLYCCSVRKLWDGHMLPPRARNGQHALKHTPVSYISTGSSSCYSSWVITAKFMALHLIRRETICYDSPGAFTQFELFNSVSREVRSATPI